MAAVILRIDDRVFECETPADAVEVARLWEVGRRPATRRAQPQATENGQAAAADDTLEKYRPIVLKWMQAVAESRPSPVPSAVMIAKLGKKGKEAGMGTLTAMADKLLEKHGHDFEKVLVRWRGRIEGNDTRGWEAGSDFDQAYKALQSD